MLLPHLVSVTQVHILALCPGQGSDPLNNAALLRAHGVLTLEARAGGLDSVLGGRVAAMTRLLNLYLDKSLGYTWIKASEVIAKSEG